MSARKRLGLLVGVFGVLALVLLSTNAIEAQGKHPAKVTARQVLNRTRHVIIHAGQVVKKGGQGKEDFREAVHHQLAARWALLHKHPVEAIALSLKAQPPRIGSIPFAGAPPICRRQ